MPPVLSTSQVHVWCVDLSRHGNIINDYLGLLSAEERARAAQFRLEQDRCRSIVGRGALRLLLAGYTGIPPDALELGVTRQGKPFLSHVAPSTIRFNLSHSGDIVLCAFCRESDIGVDVELEHTHTNCQKIAERFFSTEEKDWFHALPESRRVRAFYETWVCKEAVVKALGGGLSVPLDSFSVLFDSGDCGARVMFHADGEPVNVSLYRLRPSENHPAAVACLNEAALELNTYTLAVPDESAFSAI